MAVAAAEQLTQQTSEQSSKERFEFFDINASIDLMRYDIQAYGHIQPETRQRVYDEEMTYVAEGISRPLHTTFSLREHNGELTYFSEGEWQPYMQLLYNGLRSTEILAKTDHRKQFLHDMAVQDLANGYAMHKLNPGDSMSWYSPYRDDIELQYGATFLQEECGFQPQRRMGFLYRATRQANGAVVLESHSVDNSSEYAFSAAMQAAANPETDMETMVWAYDTALGRERGARFSAGRTMTNEEKEENVWHAMHRHGDLAALYFDDLERLAHAFLPREQTEREKKRLTIGFWAALKERLDPPRIDGTFEARSPEDIPVAAREAALRAEIAAAYQRASSRGDVLVGCGGSMKALDDLLEEMGLEQALDTVFGKDKDDSGEEDDMGPLVFECTEGHINRRPRGKLLTSCQTRPCRAGSVGC